MTDRELLELAAKAAGIQVLYWNDGDEAYSRGPGIIYGDNWIWNPLLDNGDALQLAVGLRLDIWHGKWPSGNSYSAAQKIWNVRHSIFEDDGVLHGDDPYAATRRAIVRAAAEMGKQPCQS